MVDSRLKEEITSKWIGIDISIGIGIGIGIRTNAGKDTFVNTWYLCQYLGILNSIGIGIDIGIRISIGIDTKAASQVLNFQGGEDDTKRTIQAAAAFSRTGRRSKYFNVLVAKNKNKIKIHEKGHEIFFCAKPIIGLFLCCKAATNCLIDCKRTWPTIFILSKWIFIRVKHESFYSFCPAW